MSDINYIGVCALLARLSHWVKDEEDLECVGRALQDCVDAFPGRLVVRRTMVGDYVLDVADPGDAPHPDEDPIRSLLAIHANILETNPYAYFELAYTRATGWMAWITDKPGFRESELINPDRKVLFTGQGDTPQEACSDAMAT